MKVYELIQKLLEAPAGANVFISYSDKIINTEPGEETLIEWVNKDKEGNIYVTTK